MLSLHELWLVLSLDAGLAIAGTLTVAYLVGFPDSVSAGAAGHDRPAPGGRPDERGTSADGPGGVPPARGTGEDGEWYEEAVDLASEVGRTVSGLDRPAEPDLVSRRLLPLSARIRGHVRSAPATVDDVLYRRFYELAVGCQRVALEHRPRDPCAPGLEGRLQSLATEATRVEELAATAS